MNEQPNSEEIWNLSGTKPFCDVILCRSHLHPRYQVALPAKMHQYLPSTAMTPVVLAYRGREWHMRFNEKHKRFDRDWRTFADENSLKIGDACVFELTRCNHKGIFFRTHILRGDIPREMLAKITGEDADFPIVIDD